MAKFVPTKYLDTDFNNGDRYVKGDGVQPDTLNRIIESQLYTQNWAENAPNGYSIRLSINQLDKIAEIGATTSTPINNIANFDANLKTNDILIDRYKNKDAFYLSFWKVTLVSAGVVNLSAIGYSDLITIVQQIGNSTFDVMSQKAVTETFNQAIDYIDNSVVNINSSISNNSKRISNIEALLLKDSFIYDVVNAYKKSVPLYSAPYALISKIGGMSYRQGDNTNYFNFNDTYNSGQLNITASGNALTISGIASYEGNAVTTIQLGSISIPKGKYNFNISLSEASDKSILLALTDSIYIYIPANETFATTTFSLDTETDFNIIATITDNAQNSTAKLSVLISEGKSLSDTKVTSVKSIGKNIINENKLVLQSGISLTADKYYSGTSSNLRTAINNSRMLNSGEYKPNTQYSCSLYGYCATNGTGLVISAEYTDGSIGYLIQVSSTTPRKYEATTLAGKTVKSIYATLSTDITNYIKEIIVCEGKEATYSPYKEQVYYIPQAIQSNNLYGIGIDDIYYNYVDFNNKKIVVKCKKIVFDGTETNWKMENLSSGINFYYDVPIEGVIPHSTVLSNQFASTVANATLRNNIWITTKVNITADGYFTLDAWINQLKTWANEGNPLTVIYRLASEEIQDANNIMYDNYIYVEGGGTITFENENKREVPNEIIYQVRSNI